jgi:hypothetical protein
MENRRLERSRRDVSSGVDGLRFALRLAMVLCGLALTGTLWAQSADESIDLRTAQRLHARFLRGEQLTDDELAILSQARSERTARMGDGAPPRTGVFTNQALWTRHLVPLNAPGQGAMYKGQMGGLYGDGANTPPPALADAARKAMAMITPRDGSGLPDPQGRVVLLSIGMSNTSQEFAAFKTLADAELSRSPALVIVDGAQNGRDAAQWDLAHLTSLEVWSEVERRLSVARVTPAQVQIVWIKQARNSPSRLGEFPRHAEALKDNLIAMLQEAQRRFPNLKLAYLSSRTYAGYARSTVSPEPYAYESAFAVRAVILDQMKGNPRLNSDPERGTVMAPVVLWGPYLWADGSQPRPEDGFTWEPKDVGPDGIRPSEAGREKVARLLLDFFRLDPLARPWFTGTTPEASGVESFSPGTSPDSPPP